MVQTYNNWRTCHNSQLYLWGTKPKISILLIVPSSTTFHVAINIYALVEIHTTLIKVHERQQIRIEWFRYCRKQDDVTVDTGESSSICLSLRKSAQFENLCSRETVKLFSQRFSAFVVAWSPSCHLVCNLFREADFMKETEVINGTFELLYSLLTVSTLDASYGHNFAGQLWNLFKEANNLFLFAFVNLESYLPMKATKPPVKYSSRG